MRISHLATLAVVPMALAVSAGLALAGPYTVFSDNFEQDTASFAFPDVSAPNLPGTPAVGSWNVLQENKSTGAPLSGYIQAGQITNTLPGGQTGGAGGSKSYMGMQRPDGNYYVADAVFSMPVTAVNGTLDIQWDQYLAAHAYDTWLSSTPNFAQGNNIQGYFRQIYNTTATDNGLTAFSTPGYTANSLGNVVPMNQWAHMEMQVDIANQTYSLLVNGTQVGSNLTYINSQASGYGISEIAFGGVYGVGDTSYIDNLVATVSNGPATPEPMTGGLMMLSGGLLLLKRRKKEHA